MKASETSRTVVHVAGWAWTLGGLQSVLQHHVARDAGLGFDPQVIALFDRSAPAEHPVRLAVRAWTWVGAARRRFARLAQPHAGATVMYHDGWGLRWWADRDRARRRIMYLHTETPQLEAVLQAAVPRVDAVFAISRSMLDRLHRAVPAFPVERSFYLPYLVEAAPIDVPLERPRGPVWRVGYAGRLEREHKRVERLPALVRALDATGLDYAFEILGSGSLEGALRQELAGHPRVTFCGRRAGAAYWQTLAAWDCLVLPSDFEGFSRVTMEGMMVGVLPVIPAYSAAAAEMVGPVGEAGLYPTGDMTAAAQRVLALAQTTPEQVQCWRREMLAHLAPHTVTHYEAAYRAAVEKVRALPPAQDTVAGPAGWESWLPLGVHTRLWPERF